MTNSTKEITRRNLRLDIPAVTKLLPEYFAGEFGVDSGSLTKLLELYYEYLDSDGIHSFHKEVSNIFELRDPAQNESKYLDEIIKEIGNGLTSSSFFQNPRLMAKLLPLFYKSKGSKVATEGFFRGFFGEEATIEFPKDNLLFVGGLDPSGTQGRIGFDFQNRLPNNAQFQIFSILIKSGLSVSDYESLYTRFAHPAGFNFSGQVAFDGEGVITLTSEGINPIESSVGDILLVDEATQTITSIVTELTAIFDSSANGDPNTDGVFRVSLNVNDAVSRYQDFTLTELGGIYSSIAELITPNSFTFDKTSHIIQYNARDNVGNNQRPIIKDSGIGFAIFQPDSNFRFVEDSAGATNLYNSTNRFLVSTTTTSVQWAGTTNHISGYGTTSGGIFGGDSIQVGDLFFVDAFPNNMFQVSDTVITGGTVNQYKISRLVIDSDGNGIDGPDMSLGTETMDNDMFTRYLSDSAI